MTRVTALHGTWAWSGLQTTGQWWQPGSWWWNRLRPFGCVPVALPMYSWSGDVNGVWPLVGRRFTDWEAGAVGFAGYLRPTVTGALRDTYVPIRKRRVVAHSFGGDVAILACAYCDLKIDTLVTVGTPVRKDMEEAARAALPNIGQWHHIYAPGSFVADKMQALGELFDGHWGIQRAFEIPGVQNHPVKGIDHSKALHGDPDFTRAFLETGVLASVVEGSPQEPLRAA